jgi:hypothetical protein
MTGKRREPVGALDAIDSSLTLGMTAICRAFFQRHSEQSEESHSTDLRHSSYVTLS